MNVVVFRDLHRLRAGERLKQIVPLGGQVYFQRVDDIRLVIANQNIVFALGVKFLVLILGALGYANMWAAVFADVGVSIIAILNAIRAMRVKLPDMPAGSTNQG